VRLSSEPLSNKPLSKSQFRTGVKAVIPLISFLAVAGCAIRPVTQDVTGLRVVEIVNHIRCETRVAVQKKAIAKILAIRRRPTFVTDTLEAIRHVLLQDIIHDVLKGNINDEGHWIRCVRRYHELQHHADRRRNAERPDQPHQPQMGTGVADQLRGDGSRTDKHMLIIGLSLEAGSTKTPLVAATLVPVSGYQARSALQKTRTISPAEQRALDAVQQQRIDNFLNRFGTFAPAQ